MRFSRVLVGLAVVVVVTCPMLARGETAEQAFARGNVLLKKGDLQESLQAYSAAARAQRSNQEYVHQFMLVRQAVALREGLDALRGLPIRTEVVLVADRKTDQISGVPVTWVSSVRAGTAAPFLVYYGEGPPYAMIRDEVVENETSFYHTSDPVLVEHLAFQLGRDLGVPIGD